MELTCTSNLPSKSMRIIPWDSFEIDTPLTTESLCAKLREHTESVTFLPGQLRDQSMAFRGRVHRDRFHIARRSWIPLLRMPEMHGRFLAHDGGTRVCVQMIPDTVLMVIQAFVFSMLSVIMFDTGVQVFATAAVMVLAAWFLSVFGFWLDAGASRRHLTGVVAPDA